MSSDQYVDVNRSLDNLASTDINPENIREIRGFIDHCAAEGISESRQQRYVYCWKSLLEKFAPDSFRMKSADESDLKQLVAALNRSEYAEESKATMKAAVKKYYKIDNGGRKEPEKTKFFTLTKKKSSTVSREDLFTSDELKRLFCGCSSIRDKAFTMILYESAARPGELLACNIGDFTSNSKGDLISIEGSKNTPDRTNQLVRAGRTIREWLSQHPFGGELGSLKDPSAPLWVKTEQQACKNCGGIPHNHDDDQCRYEPNLADRLNYAGFLRRFKKACEKADIPSNKRRPYNLRHTRLTEVATFMGYEQLNKFAGWKPGSDRAKVYVHLNNEDVNKAIRDEYGLASDSEEESKIDCPFCGSTNQSDHSECRQCGRPLSMEKVVEMEEKLNVLERLQKLEQQGILDKLADLDDSVINA